MATLSVTFSQLAPNVKATHTGQNAVGGALSFSATWSTSTIGHMCLIPNNATLIDYWLKYSVAGTSDLAFQVGTSFSPSGIMALTTLSQTFSISTQNVGPVASGIYNQGWLRAPGASDFFPIRISLSDDAQPASIWAQLRTSKSITGSFYVTFLLWYTMDGLTGHTQLNK